MPLTNSSNPKPPRTDAQREAARRNGAKSKGPVTLEGKRISALNATRHGLRAEKPFVLENESAEDFEEFREAIVQRCQPADKLELDLCVEMAHARWRLHRTWTIETAMLDNKMTQQHEHLLEEWSPLDEGTRLSEAWTALANYGQGLSLLHRYEARLRRTFERALQNLERLQRHHEKMPNEPEPPAKIELIASKSKPTVPDEPDPPSSALEDAPLPAHLSNEPERPAKRPLADARGSGKSKWHLVGNLRPIVNRPLGRRSATAAQDAIQMPFTFPRSARVSKRSFSGALGFV